MAHYTNAMSRHQKKYCGSLNCLILVAVGAAAAIGCQSARRGEPIVGPMAVMDSKFIQGKKIFYERCYHCHPGGEGGLGPALNDKPVPGFLMKTQVRLGLGVMPGFSKEDINPDELDALVAYLKKVRKHDNPELQHEGR
jgi:mono/diheme cytochrome c family protein